MREAGKSSLYRHEVRRAAIDAVVQAVRDVAAGDVAPEPLDYSRRRRLRPPAAADHAGGARDRLDARRDRHRAAADPRRRGPPRRARQHRRRAVPPVRRATARARCAAGPARSSRTRHGADLPRHGRRRGLDHAPEGARRLQAAGHARARAGRRGARRAGGSGDWREIALRGARRRRLPALRLLQRRDEHRPVPPAARGLPLRDAAADARDRADGRPRLLLQRHPPQRDRGGRGPGHRVVVEPARDRRRRARHRRDRLAPGDLGAGRRRRGRRRAVRAGRRPRRGARGRRAQPVLPAHGRALRLRVLDLPDAAPDRPRADRRADLGAVRADRHPPRRRDRAARRRLRRGRAALPRPGRARSPPSWPACPTWRRCSRPSGARAGATSRSSRSRPTAPRSWRKSHECFFGPDRSYHEARHRFVHKLGAPCVVTPAAARRAA